jgi:type I restriction enzyme R subunit
LIEACRVPLNKHAKVNEEAEPIIPAKKMPGVSMIVHSCEAGSPTTEYFNLDKLRKSLDIDRRITIKELIQLVFGKIPFIKNKNQLLEEEFDKFDDRYLPNPNDYDTIKGFFQSYLTDGELRDIVESKKYGLLNTHPSGQFFKNVPEEYRKIIPDYIKNYVPLNKFVS